MRTVLLYGSLRKRFGKRHRFAVKTTSEAIRALCANFRGFEGAVAQGKFHLVVGQEEKGYQDLHDPVGERETIRLVPAISGGKSPFVQILVGAVLVAAAIAVPGLGAAALSIGLMGGAMILGGVSQLLTTPPKQEEYKQSDNNSSFLFNGPTNSDIQGASVPLVYGRMIVGSKVISAGIETHDIA